MRYDPDKIVLDGRTDGPTDRTTNRRTDGRKEGHENSFSPPRGNWGTNNGNRLSSRLLPAKKGVWGNCEIEEVSHMSTLLALSTGVTL